MRVCVVGAGYVGLVTGACLADQGHAVTCVDLDQGKVGAINRGSAPFHEPGLPEVLARTAGKTLRATTALGPAAAAAEVILLAVGTPFRNGAIDLSAVEAASHGIGAALARAEGYRVVAVRSTVVPGTTEGLIRETLEQASGHRAGADFGLGMNPEFLTEGQALDDFLRQDRIVIGAIDQRSRAVLAELYAGFPASVPRHFVSPRTAELIKYASNALLATAISFSNELADLAADLGGVDIAEVMRGVHSSRYLTANGSTAALASYLEAGCGYGGSCLPKDVKALVAHGQAGGLPMRLLASVDQVNAGRPARLLDLARKHFASLAGVRATVLGLAFKPGTDDVRETPAVPVIEALRAEGAQVTVFDPVALKAAPRLFPDGGVQLAGSLAEAVRSADVVFLVTRWPEFAAVPELVAQMAHPPLVVDGRRVIDPASVPRYEGVGRG